MSEARDVQVLVYDRDGSHYETHRIDFDPKVGAGTCAHCPARFTPTPGVTPHAICTCEAFYRHLKRDRGMAVRPVRYCTWCTGFHSQGEHLRPTEATEDAR